MKTIPLEKAPRLLVRAAVVALLAVSAAFLAGCGGKSGKGENDFRAGMEAYGADRYEEAVRCFEKAAAAGHAEAMFKLALCYGKGNGVEKDEEKAFRYLDRSAEAGNAKAKFLTVTKDADDNLISRDEALKRFNELDAGLLKLAEADDPEAQTLYALLCLLQGKSDEARDWAKKAEANGGKDLFGF